MSARSGHVRASPAQSLIVPVTRRFRRRRLARASAYRLGEALGDRVLLGTTPGGSPMALCMRDHQHRAIYFHGEYEPEITALFRRLLAPGATVFDIGANAGYFSLLAAELGASVHAFEPNPSVRALLCRSARLSPGEIEVVAAACSDRECTLMLHLSDPRNTGMSSVGADGVGTGSMGRGTGMSSGGADDAGAGSVGGGAGISNAGGNVGAWCTNGGARPSVRVAAITLDAYARRSGARPDLIKVDVEGHEREALAGAEWLLERSRPAVIAETGGVATVELMAAHGYTPHRILPDGSLQEHDGRLRLVGGYENICYLARQLPEGAPRGCCSGALPRSAGREGRS